MFAEANLKKLDFLFGKGGGNQHNINRSRTMLRQLEIIGLPDTPESRDYLANHLQSVLVEPTSIAELQPEGREVRESLLMGPRGGLKVQSIWEGEKLITVALFGGL